MRAVTYHEKNTRPCDEEEEEEAAATKGGGRGRCGGGVSHDHIGEIKHVMAPPAVKVPVAPAQMMA